MDDKSTFYYDGTRDNIVGFLPSEYSKVLEVGCGNGSFRYSLNSDCEYWGVEPQTIAHKSATEKLDKTLLGTYQEVAKDLPDNYFDLIICNDVIEHMSDHDEFLDEIRIKMKDNAYIVGAIPNVRFFPNLFLLMIKKDWEYQDEGILDRTHLRFFTRKSLIRTLKQHGYSIEEFAGINNLSYKPTSIKKITKFIVTRILGKDTLSQQFAFRIKK